MAASAFARAPGLADFLSVAGTAHWPRRESQDNLLVP
jgi:hypothetical protein